ncbi:MAG: tetratricopeptide repeat protein [Thermoanaerobaculales bacterium]
MKTPKRFLSVALLVFVASSANTSGLRLPKEKERWIEVRTENFLFYSNAGRSSTRRVAADLEELRAVLAEVTDLDLRSPIPTRIYVFRSERSFEPFKILYQGNPSAISGYFIRRKQANYIAINADSPDASGIVFHEYVHYVAANNFWYIPVWFEEGLAEFYQSFQVIGDTVFIGQVITPHLLWLRGSTPIPLAELFAVDHSSPLYTEEDRRGAFYAQSWALVHYLLLGNQDRRLQLEKYLDLERRGTPEKESFSRAFGTDYRTLEHELRAYLNRKIFSYLKTSTEIDIDALFRVRRMGYAETLYRLGDLLAQHSPERPERIDYFEAALKADPEHGPSLAALGLEAELAADWDGARQAYERAVRATPNDPLVLYRWGRFLRHRGNDPDRSLAVLTRSAQLDPGFAPTWVALAGLYADLGDASAEAISVTETAHRLLPSEVEPSFDLLRLYLRLDRREDAKALLERAFAANPTARARGWMLLLQNDFRRIHALLSDDRIAAALDRLELAEAGVEHSSNPALLRQRVSDLRRAATDHEGAKVYDRCLELFNRGESSAAKTLLEEVLAELEDGPLALACEQLLSIIENPEPTAEAPQGIMEHSPTPEEISFLNELLAANDLERALRYLRNIRSRSLGRQELWINAKIKEIRQTLEYNRFVEEYNLAVDLFNKKRYGETIRALEKLLASLPEGAQADAARNLLEDARTAERAR